MTVKRRTLHILTFDRQAGLTYLCLDRARDRAQLVRFAPFPSIRRTTPLSSITSVLVSKQELIENKPEYDVILRFHDSGPIRLTCLSRKQAMDILRRTAHFLGLHNHPGDPQTGAPTVLGTRVRT